MSNNDWAFVKRLAAEQGVTLKDAGVRRSMRLGQAIDWVLAAAGR